MFGTKKNKSEVNNFIVRYGEKDSTLVKLKSNSYLIVYKYNAMKEAIEYKAISKKSSTDTIECVILANGQMEGYLTNIGYYFTPSVALYYYICWRDLRLSKEKLKSIYGPVLDKINQTYHLNENQLATRYQSRKKMTQLFEMLRKENVEIEPEQGKVRIELNLEATEENRYFISFRVGIDKFYSVKSVSSFVNLISSEATYSYGKGLTFNHELASFENHAKKAIGIIRQNITLNGSTNDKSYRISEQTVYEFLDAYRDDFVIFNSKRYYVDREIAQGNVKIDENGKVVLSPLINGQIINSNNNIILIEPKTSTISIMKFENKTVKNIFSFFAKNEVDLEACNDIFVEKIFPLIKTKVKVDENYNYKNDRSLEIKLYIDLDDRDQLTFKTEYIVDNSAKNKDELILDYTYRSQIEAYLTVIKKYGFEEIDVFIDETQIYDFLKSDISDLNKVCTVLLSEKLKTLQIKKMPKIRVSTSYDMDWLNIEVQSDELDYDEMNKILSAYRLKKKYYKLKDKIIMLEDENLYALDNLTKNIELDNEFKTHDVPFYEAFKLKVYDENFDISFEDKIKNIFSEIKGFKKFKLNLPSTLNVKLRKYQEEGVKWLSVLNKNHLGGILADDMGLGKTIEMIAFISILDDGPVMIVSPKSLIFNWQSEFQKFLPKQKVVVINGMKNVRDEMIKNIKQDKKVVYITSYDSMRNDIEEYKDLEFNLAVLDEAQYIKNMYALKTKAIKELNARSRFVLTGTPIENYLSDLWSIFDFIMPNYLLNYNEFKSEYETLIVNEDSKLTKRKLVEKITPFILRRTKKDVLKDLPPKTEVIKTIVMSDEQNKLYNSWLGKVKASIRMNESKINQLALLTRLRQICVDPSMFLENYNEISEKLNLCISLVEEAIGSNHKVLIFSSFTKSLEHLKELLNKKTIPSYYIHGGVEAKARMQIANDFNNTDNVKVALISLKAGGTGLNLVGADIVIHIDPWWNVAAENQATDRAHRIGQVNPVTVIKIVCKDSIEEKVIKLQEIKSELSSSIISDNGDAIQKMEVEDISYLLD